jgi:hypothetical protein
MNATHWATLSNFCTIFGAKVEQTGRGWYIQYRPVQTIQQQEEALRRQQQAAADKKSRRSVSRENDAIVTGATGTHIGTSKVAEPTELQKNVRNRH